MSSQSALRITDLGRELGISTAGQLSQEQSLPISDALRELFPHGIRRGSTISVDTTSLMLLLLAASTRAGSWAAIAGFPNVGVVAAEEIGVQLERCAFVPYFTANNAAKVVAALIDSVDFVVIHRANDIAVADARRLIARARERKSVLVLSKTAWPNITPITLTVSSSSWERTANGCGRLKGRWVDVVASGRGAMSRASHSSVWLGDGEPTQKSLQFRPKSVAKVMA
jgi:hypothetical protein